MKLEQHKFPNTLELFKQLVEVKVPIDSWLDSMPEDIDTWNIEYEFTDYPGKVEYRCLIKHYDIEDGNFIVNALIETRPIHE